MIFLLKVIFSAAVLALIMLFPQASVDGARRAMLVWYKSVAPSLFPFFVLMPTLTGGEACRMYERMFSRVMKRLFDLPGTATPAVLICMLAGSPAGATAIKRVACSGGLREKDAGRIAFAMCGLCPVYLVLGIGQGLYGSISMGWKLASTQLGIQIVMLFLTRWTGFSGAVYSTIQQAGDEGGIKSAVESILGICGYMVFFGVLTAPIALFAGRKWGMGVLLLADLPGGSSVLSELNISGQIPLQCAAAGFGGLCIAFQNMKILKEIGVSWKDYLAGRGISAGLFACAGMLFMNTPLKIKGTVVNVDKALEIGILISCITAAPLIFLLTKNLFLNKLRCRENQSM